MHLSFASLSALCRWILEGKVGGCSYVTPAKTVEKMLIFVLASRHLWKKQVILLFIQ